jgi:hypothetical protein
MHSIITCLLYSKKLPHGRKSTKKTELLQIACHDETKGCIADFTGDKCDDRVDILTGYICEQHQNQIKMIYGKKYLEEILMVINRKWIGSIEEKGTVAYDLKHVFRFDINKDSGFNKSVWDRCKEKFYEIPGHVAGEVIKVILIAFVTYLLIKYGIVEKGKAG